MSDRTSGAAADPVAATRARLDHSRQALLAALVGVTEADFARAIEGDSGGDGDGRPLVELLAALARDELQAVEAARRLLDAAAASDGPPAAGGAPSAKRPATLPPQAIHALAGARHRAARLLDELAAARADEEGGDRSGALALLDAAAEREQRVAERIAGRAGEPAGGAG